MKTIDITQKQLDKVQKDFSRFVADFSDLGVSDYEYSDDTVRVFVDFDYCLCEVDIKKIDILDNDYEDIHSENALAIRCFIEKIVADYNEDQDNLEKRLSEESEYRNYVMFGLYY